MPLITCYAKLNFDVPDLRSLLTRRDTIMTSKYNLMIRNLFNKNSGCIYYVNIVTENVIYQSAGFIRHSGGQCDTWEEAMGDNHIKIDIAVPFRINFLTDLH